MKQDGASVAYPKVSFAKIVPKPDLLNVCYGGKADIERVSFVASDWPDLGRISLGCLEPRRR